MFKIGDIVNVIATCKAVQVGTRCKIVGTDPEPPLKSKRQGPCFIVAACDSDNKIYGDWMVRRPNELEVVP